MELRRALVFKLAVPLGIVAIVLLFIEEYCPYEGFYVNLATEILGIIVTVFVVEHIIRRYDEDRWSQTTRRVRVAIVQFTDFAGHGILSALGIDPKKEVFPPDPASPTVFEQLALVVQNAIEDAVATLDPSLWPNTIVQIKTVADRAATLIVTYGARLNHEQVEHLAVIETHLSTVIGEYAISRDLFDGRSTAERRELEIKKRSISLHLKQAAARLWLLRRSVLQTAA